MIRLTLLLVVAMVTAMMIWGTEDPQMRAGTITSNILDDAAGADYIPELVEDVAVSVATDPKPKVEVASLDALDLTRIGKSGGLLVFEASDAPAGARIPITVSETATLLTVTGSSVNLRAGPSTNRSVVGKMRRGAKAELVAEAADGWLQIRDLSSGNVGYMSADFLTASN